MSSLLKDLYNRLSKDGNLEVEVSDKGVLHVDTKRLLESDRAKQQVEAVQRLETTQPAKHRKSA